MRIWRASLVEVIRVVSTEGEGTAEDKAREVTSYWSKDGKLLGVWDEAEREKKRAKEEDEMKAAHKGDSWGEVKERIRQGETCW